MRVARLARASPNAWHLELESASPVAFEAGQAMMLGLAGQPLRKPYSIASSPEEAAATGRLQFLLGTEDDDDIGIHLRGAGVESSVVAEGPLGSFVLPARLETSRVLFAAGGTGIAPLRAMWRSLAVRAPQVHVAFHYSARSPGHFVYLDELCKVEAESGGRLVVVTHTTRVPESALSSSRGGAAVPTLALPGRIDRTRLASGLDAADTRAFVCGPPAFVDHVTRTLAELGVPSWRIHAEQW
jgi:ferredoxin-NADP reductase